jgi:hypothetical protein
MRSFLKKLTELDSLIHEQCTGSPANLGLKIGASERSVFDYLKLMKTMGAPIGYSRYKGTYFYQTDGRFTITFINMLEDRAQRIAAFDEALES